MASEPKHVADARAAMLQTVRLFGVEGTCLSFNGGKDSTVLLHLLRTTLPDTFTRIPVIFFQQANEFPEIIDFVHDMAERYNLNMIYIDANFKEGLQRLQRETPIKAIFLGTRAGDPHTDHLELFSPTDIGWPAFMRVHPIKSWCYAEVWKYLEQLPYCILYDKGYTSLGSTLDTERNRLLLTDTGTYKPAVELCDGKYERCGRPGYPYDLPHTAAVVRVLDMDTAHPDTHLAACLTALKSTSIQLGETVAVSPLLPLRPTLAYLAQRHDLIVLLAPSGRGTLDTMLEKAKQDKDYAQLLRHTAMFVVRDTDTADIAAAIREHCPNLP